MNSGQVDEIRWGPPTGWMRQHFAVTGEAERRRKERARCHRYYWLTRRGRMLKPKRLEFTPDCGRFA